MSTSARTASRMEPLSARDDEASEAQSLAASLGRLVADPDRVGALHSILGPFCHQSRNVLNSVKMSLYLVQREESRKPVEAWAEVERRYRDVEQLYDRLQSICRPYSLTCVRMPLSLLIEDRRATWLAWYSDRGKRLELVAPHEPDVGDYDPNSLAQALDALVAWRADDVETGDSACLCWWTKGGQFHLEWTESDARPGGVERRRSGEASRPERTDPLVLPLLGRVISAHGGEIELVRPSGRHLRLCWPQVGRLPQ
jgi:hypothetical protein